MNLLFFELMVPICGGFLGLALIASRAAAKALREDDAFIPQRRRELDNIVNFPPRIR